MKEPIVLPKFDLTRKRPQVLLLGNGLCRKYGNKSLDSILDDTIKKYNNTYLTNDIRQLSFPMQIVAASNDHVDDVCRKLSAQMKKKDYYNQYLIDNYSLFLQYLNLPVDVILTTNYSYELEMAIDHNFIVHKDKYAVFSNGIPRSKNGTYRRESKYQLHSFYRMKIENQPKDIWHIHGEASNFSSMVLGHYYYGNLLTRYKSEVDRSYRQNVKNDRRTVILSPTSWLDYFVFGDVYIIGFGYDMAEMDLWWLLNRKKREKQVKGKVYFFDISNSEQIQRDIMLKNYDVQIQYIKNTGYDYYYKHATHMIDRLIKSQTL